MPLLRGTIYVVITTADPRTDNFSGTNDAIPDNAATIVIPDLSAIPVVHALVDLCITQCDRIHTSRAQGRRAVDPICHDEY